MRSFLARFVPILVLAACGAPEPGSDNAAEAPPESAATYVGREVCAPCHAAETDLFEGSDHDLSMEPADASTVLGDFGGRSFEYAGVTSTFFERDGKFMVRTDGPDGELADFEIAYTFGVTPLQQYLLPFEGGRYQVLSIAWDTRPKEEGGERWFHLYPDERIDYRDPLHWTKRFQRWNLMCASCHSTGLRKEFSLEKEGYETTWFEIDVSCEACHGPGSRHVAWANGARTGDPALTVPLRSDEPTWVMNALTGIAERQPPRTEHVEVETCAPCHSRRSQLREDDPNGQMLLQDFRPSLLEEPLYYADGQIRDEVYVYGSFLQSKMYRKGVTCQDCHDPHGLYVRGGEGNAVCASCHLPEKFDTEKHHFHQTGSEGSFCVDCHMPETTYMVVDPRRDHSFRVPRPDLTESTGAPNACNRCHQDRSAGWAREKLISWTGHEPTPHYGEAFFEGDRDRLAQLVADEETSVMVRASAAARLQEPALVRKALRDDEALVRLGGLDAADALDPDMRHQLLVPLLEDPVRAVRIEAARALASVPQMSFTPDQHERLDRALAEYRDVQKLNADWPEAHLNLGLVDAQLGRLDDAEREYRTALELDPAFVRAFVNLADLYRLQGRNERSERVLEEALAIAPDDADVHHALGLALVRSKKNREAVEELRRAFELRPDLARYAYVYGVALQSTGDVEGAIHVLEEASARHPRDVELLFALVTLNRDRGALDEALRYARKLAALRPADPVVRRLLAQLEAAASR